MERQKIEMLDHLFCLTKRNGDVDILKLVLLATLMSVQTVARL